MYQRNKVSFVFFFLVILSAPHTGLSMEQSEQQQVRLHYDYMKFMEQLRENKLKAIQQLAVHSENKNEMLCLAVAHGSDQAVSLLVNNGAQASVANMHDVAGNSLIAAAFSNSYGLTLNMTEQQKEELCARMLIVLVKNGASLDKKDRVKQWRIWKAGQRATMQEVYMSPLMQAIYYQNLPAVRTLIALKASKKDKDSLDYTVNDYLTLFGTQEMKDFFTSSNQ